MDIITNKIIHNKPDKTINKKRNEIPVTEIYVLNSKTSNNKI